MLLEIFLSFMIFYLISGIRHPEELSLVRKLEKEDLKKNTFVTLRSKRHQQQHQHHDGPHSPGNWNSPHNSSNSLDRLGNRSPITHSPHVKKIFFFPLLSFFACLKKHLC